MDLNALLDIGLILLSAALGASLIKLIGLPRITSYIVIGILIGPSLLDLVSPSLLENSGIFTNIALSFIAFDLGKKFTSEKIGQIGRSVFTITLIQALFTLGVITTVMLLISGLPIHLAMVYGAIGCATAPAATILVTRDSKSSGSFTDTLLGVVALDDGLGIILFALFLSAAKAVSGMSAGGSDPIIGGLLHGSREILGAVVLGSGLGWLLANFPRVFKKQASISIYTLGIVLFNAGLCIHFEFSVLLAGLALGIAVENFSEEDVEFFSAVEKVESPFYVLFFVLAGAHLEIGMLIGVSMVGIVYIAARFAGKIGGTWLGAVISGAGDKIRKWLGIALLPQAGVALGFALIVKNEFSGASGDEVFFVILASTVFFEILGPVFTQVSLKAAGETGD